MLTPKANSERKMVKNGTQKSSGRQEGAEAPAQVLALWNWAPSAPVQAPVLRKVRIWVV
jgi:hypothetical protein